MMSTYLAYYYHYITVLGIIQSNLPIPLFMQTRGYQKFGHTKLILEKIHNKSTLSVEYSRIVEEFNHLLERAVGEVKEYCKSEYTGGYSWLYCN